MRDDARRMAAIEKLYRTDAVLYEADSIVEGHQAISATVGGLLASLPDGFRFEVDGTAHAHHGVAVARWRGGSPAAVIATGSEVARISDGLIAELYVFLDPQPGS